MDLAISPCPNDTFIFCHLMRSMPDLQLVFADVEELNQRALVEKKHALSKLSFYAILRAKGYTLLDSGGAMGQGCGPILLYGKKSNGKISDLKRILTPGRSTTAALLLDLFLAENHPDPQSVERVPVRYDRILPSLGEEEAGLIIHEERFTYPSYGAVKAQDLGEWWEQTTGLPIPLGGIVIRNDLLDRKSEIESKIRESLQAAWKDPASVKDFVKCYSQSLEDTVIQSHIDLYVNRYTESLGEDGMRALEVLRQKAEKAGLL